MIVLKVIGITLGWVWSFPGLWPGCSLFGLLLALTVYFPKKVRFRRGYVQIVVRWSLIPKGFDTNRDGDLDDPEDFRTGGQTHGCFMFHSDERQWDRADHVHHEETHVWQCMVLGFLLHPLIYGCSYVVNRLRGMDPETAYKNVLQERQAYRRQREFIERRRRATTPTGADLVN